MQKRPVEVVHNIEKRKQNFAFAGFFRKRAFLSCPAAIVIKFSQQPKVPFTLVS